MLSLASEIGYDLTMVEMQLYLAKLGHYGLKFVAEACLEFRESGYPRGVFPSIDEFSRVCDRLLMLS